MLMSKMVALDLWMDLQLMKDVWKCATMATGVQSVLEAIIGIHTGIIQMLRLFVVN